MEICLSGNCGGAFERASSNEYRLTGKLSFNEEVFNLDSSNIKTVLFNLAHRSFRFNEELKQIGNVLNGYFDASDYVLPRTDVEVTKFVSWRHLNGQENLDRSCKGFIFTVLCMFVSEEAGFDMDKLLVKPQVLKHLNETVNLRSIFGEWSNLLDKVDPQSATNEHRKKIDFNKSGGNFTGTVKKIVDLFFQTSLTYFRGEGNTTFITRKCKGRKIPTALSQYRWCIHEALDSVTVAKRNNSDAEEKSVIATLSTKYFENGLSTPFLDAAIYARDNTADSGDEQAPSFVNGSLSDVSLSGKTSPAGSSSSNNTSLSCNRYISLE